MNSDELEARDRADIEPFFPSVGWTERIAVPADMAGATLLAVGSAHDHAELVIEYRAPNGAEKRMVLGFTERGMWIQSICDRRLSIQDDGQ
jgi:hypothetical protein